MSHFRRAGRTRYKGLGKLLRVSERDSPRDADAVAIHRMKVRRRPESPVRHRERIVALATLPRWPQHPENNAQEVDRSLIAKKSCLDRETPDSETRPISVHTASPRQSEFRRPTVFPLVVWEVSASSCVLVRGQNNQGRLLKSLLGPLVGLALRASRGVQRTVRPTNLIGRSLHTWGL